MVNWHLSGTERSGEAPEGGTGGTDEAGEARQAAVEHVVDRVGSWDEGAEEDTVRGDLEDGMTQAGVEVDDAELDRMAQEIHTDGRTEAPEVD